MFKLCDPKLISSTVPLLLASPIKEVLIVVMLVVLVTGRVEKATQKTCNSFRTCLSSLPPIYLWAFAYLFVDIHMILYLILAYHLIHGTTPIYLLSLSYLSAWIYQKICLFVPFAKVGSLPKWISNRSSIMSWGARVLSFETGLMVATSPLKRPHSWTGLDVARSAD